MLSSQIYLAYYELSVHIMSHGVVFTPNACHAKAWTLIHRSGVQVSKKQNVSSLPNRKDSVLWELL